MDVRTLKGFIVAGVLLFQPGFAGASLGERGDSVEADRYSLKATLVSTTQKAQYTVHEIDDGGTSIKEYESAQGRIFAVSWKGLHRPDLAVIFGQTYTKYLNEKSSTIKVAGRQPLNVSNDEIVVRHAGHMRDVRGQAYLPALVPAGLNMEGLL